MADHDLVIRNGVVIDGSGSEPFAGDIAIDGERISMVGTVPGRGAEEINAAGLTVVPGFVDVHTHYDGQVTWDNRALPSAAHGVTTVVMGNCGVGFAPCRPSDRRALIELMEGVEDIPDLVMTAGIPWNWETFPQYLDALDARSFDVDVAAQLPHSCLRVYVMGQRGIDRDTATDAELAEMTRLTEEAMRAGAIGFATSRSIFHRDRNGKPIPSKEVVEPELQAIAAGMKAAGHGVIEALIDYDDIDDEFGLLRRLVESSGRPLSFTVSQLIDSPDGWRNALRLIGKANDDGLPIRGQVIGRPTGILLGLNLSFHPFSFHPSYQEIAHLPLPERVAAMRTPEIRNRILTPSSQVSRYKILEYLESFDGIYDLGTPPDYAPRPENSMAAIAHATDREPREVTYDALLTHDGNAILFLPIGNYADGDLDAVSEMLHHPNTILGLGDGGAHYGVICDAGWPTFMLTRWVGLQEDGRFSLAELIRRMTAQPAEAVGLADRGLLKPGYKADINILHYKRMHLHPPHVVFDLPAGGRRLLQAADGYAATIVSGQITYRNAEPTGALPGRLVRGPQNAVR
ncbi:MAG: amidohydrolase family protein [Sphingomonadaceae bacterium]